MENCLFCKIVREEIPCYKVYEDGNFIAFLDIRPLNQGHTLLIPKKHYRWVWEMKEEYSSVYNKLAQALQKALETEYIQALVMGEEIHHAHLHLIPRFPRDGHPGLVDLHHIKNLTKEEMAGIVERIKAVL